MSMTLAIAGTTSCLWKTCSPTKRGSATRCASQANAPVHPRIAVVSGGTRAFWRLYKTRSTPSMRRWWTGSVANLIQRPLIWTRSTASSKTSHLLEGEGSDNFADHRSWKGVCSKWRWALVHRASTGIAVHTYATHGRADQALHARPYGQMRARHLLSVPCARAVDVRLQMPCLCTPMIGRKTREPQGLQ